MKGQFMAFLAVIFLIFSMSPAVCMGNASLNNAPQIFQEHLDLTFAPPEVVRVGDYNWLKMPDCSYVSIPGHPMLPIKSAVEKLPLNSHITQIIAEVEDMPLDGNYFIMPALAPIQVGSTEPMSISLPDQTIYGKDQLYPDEWYDYRVCNGLDPESNRRVQYVSFYFYPLRYLPTDQKILLAQNVSFTIIYTEPAEEATAQTVLKNLIITSDTLEPYAIQLATYKNSTGISSRAVNLTWVYKNYDGIDRQEQIRNCIKDFATSYGITYVTIFGDADQVPVRSVFVNDTEAGEPYVPTDLYYGDLDGTWDDNNDGIYGDRRYDNVDGIPDVYVGRIPPSLANQAQTAVDKIIGYQQQFNTSESWTRRVVLAAGTGSGDGFSNPFGIAFPFLKNYTANINVNKDIVKLYEAYGNLSTGSMASELNKGALFANFAGHGNPAMWLFYWVNPSLYGYNGYGIVDVQGLTNGFKLPVVTTMACSTARFDDQDCIGEWFVLQPNGGSIAYFGATRIAWGYVDQGITTGLMGEIDWRIYQNFYEGYSRLGQMWGQTAKEYVQNHIWNYKYASVLDVKTLMEFILLGDPTLRVYSDSVSTFEFSLGSASPSSRIVTAGDYTTYSVPVTLVSGSGSVALSCSGLPSGATCSFNPSSGNPTFSSTLTVYTSTGTPGGTYTLTVAGTGGGQTHFTTVQLVVVNSTSSTVTVYTEDPAGVPVSSALIYLNNTCRAATSRYGNVTIANVLLGNYVLTVRKTGYLNYSTLISVPPSARINITLSKPPVLTVYARDSLTGNLIPFANVYLNGTFKGVTDYSRGNCTISDTLPGDYLLTVNKTGYWSNSTVISVTSDLTINRTLTKMPSVGTIIVTVKDASDGYIQGAEIYLNGSYANSTDINGKLVIQNVSTGSYRVTAVKTGYDNASSSTVVYKGGTANVYLVMKVKTYSVTVNVKDSGGSAAATANVFLNGTFKGATISNGTLVINGVFPGNYTLGVKKGGYADYANDMNVTSNMTINVTLTKAYTLTINVKDSSTGNPISYADIYLDGVYVETTDYFGKLIISGVAEGPHTLTVKKTGYLDYSSTINMTSSITLTIPLAKA
jgi:hypothetical protein